MTNRKIYTNSNKATFLGSSKKGQGKSLTWEKNPILVAAVKESLKAKQSPIGPQRDDQTDNLLELEMTVIIKK